MKADTRHQLKTNELGEALLKVRFWFEKNWRNVALVGGSALVLIVAVNIWRWSHASAVDAAWARLFEIETTGEADPAAAIQRLRDLASSSGDPVISVIARYRAGCALLHHAGRDPANRPQLLEESIASLKLVFDDSAAPPTIAAAAGFALASAFENKRDFDAAKSAYDAIVKNNRFDGTPYQNLAAVRSTELDELRTITVRFEPGRPSPAGAPSADANPPAPPNDSPHGPPVIPSTDASSIPPDSPASQTDDHVDSGRSETPQPAPPSDPDPSEPPTPNHGP